MKKSIIVLLVAVLAISSVFAGLSGSAEIDFAADLKTKNFGFANSKGAEFTFEIAADTLDAAGEGDIYASLKASAKILVAPAEGTNSNIMINAAHGFGVILDVSEARINGSNWYIDILGVKSAADYAKPVYLTKDKKSVVDSFGYKDYIGATEPNSYAAKYTKAPGLTVSYDGWTASAGFYKDATVGTDASATFETKKIAVEGFSFQAAVEASQRRNDEDATKNHNKSFGGSVMAEYATDDLSVKAAADMGYMDEVFDMDARVDAAYDFVSADAYFRYSTKYLEAEVKTNLDGFDVPVALTVYAKDIVSDSNKQEFGAKAVVTANEAVGLTVKGSYSLTKKVTASATVDYSHEMFDASATASFETTVGTDNSSQFYIKGSVSSDAIISGATLGLSYGAGLNAAGDDYRKMNFLADQTVAQDFGKITAYCAIEF